MRVTRRRPSYLWNDPGIILSFSSLQFVKFPSRSLIGSRLEFGDRRSHGICVAVFLVDIRGFYSAT